MNHVTIIERRADKRMAYFQAGGKRRTLCGALITASDILYTDAVIANRLGELSKWLTCPACATKIQQGK